MIINNKRPCMVSLGPLNLRPGNNILTQEQWDAIPIGFKKEGKKRKAGVIGAMVEEGLLEIIDGDVGTKKDDIKLTVALIKETNDTPTLEGWYEKAPGPIKAAIKAQIKLLEVEVPNKDKK